MKLGEYYIFFVMCFVLIIEFKSEKRKEWKYYVLFLSVVMFFINMVVW